MVIWVIIDDYSLQWYLRVINWRIDLSWLLYSNWCRLILKGGSSIDLSWWACWIIALVFVALDSFWRLSVRVHRVWVRERLNFSSWWLFLLSLIHLMITIWDRAITPITYSIANFWQNIPSINIYDFLGE